MVKQSERSLFALEDFRAYVQSWARARGRGEFRRISEALSMHTTLVSQVFNGRKCLTEEQASRLCAYMGLNSLETDYFLKLVQLERAGNENLKEIFRRHLCQIRDQASEVRSRVPESRKLREEDRAIFYSSWQYAIVRLLTSVSGKQTVEEIAAHLNLSVSRVSEILNFLVTRGLCKSVGGKYLRTEQNTHVESQSALSTRHHQNWRVRSLELIEKMSGPDLSFTAPVALSRRDRAKVRTILLGAISEISNLVEPSESEEIVYLGIDWLRI